MQHRTWSGNAFGHVGEGFAEIWLRVDVISSFGPRDFDEAHVADSFRFKSEGAILQIYKVQFKLYYANVLLLTT